jgi:hypothetical protein
MNRVCGVDKLGQGAWCKDGLEALAELLSLHGHLRSVHAQPLDFSTFFLRPSLSLSLSLSLQIYRVLLGGGIFPLSQDFFLLTS